MKNLGKRKFMIGYLDILFIIAVIAYRICSNFYKVTAISLIHVVIFLIGIGIVATQMSPSKMELFYARYVPSYWGYLIYNIITWGVICLAIFLSTNFYLAKAESQRVEIHEIISRKVGYSSNDRGSRRKIPKFKIDYHGLKKDIIFRSNVAKSIDGYESVNLEIQDGGLGYDVFKHTSLNVIKRQ